MDRRVVSRRGFRRVAPLAALVAAGLYLLPLRPGVTVGAGEGAAGGASQRQRAAPAPGGVLVPQATAGHVAAPAGVALPIDLRAVIDQVHFAFRREGSGWEAGHATWRVRLEEGELEVTPYAPPGGEPRTREAVEGAAIRFGAASVARGGTVLVDGAGVAGQTGDGQLDVQKGSVTERLRNGREGVEQSWSFAGIPEGRGDLEVRVPLRAGALVGESEGGLHLSAGALGLRYGHGTWVDGLGNATRVAARWDRDAIVLTVPGDVLEGSVYPAVLDPVISPEYGMGDPIGVVPISIQQNPVIAWGGGVHLVVWDDFRAGSTHLFGARVSATGSVLDPVGFRVCAAGTGEAYADVAWNGSDFLVVWNEARGTTDWDVYGTLVGADGSVPDPDGFAISTSYERQLNPAVGSDGSGFLVAWSDYRNVTTSISDVYATRVSGTGVVSEPAGFVVAAATREQESPAVAWNGTNYFVAWKDGRNLGTTNFDIYGARVTPAGSVLDAGIAISTAAGGQEAPSVAWNGTWFLVAWQDARNSVSGQDIYAARVSAAGVVQEASGIAVSTASGGQSSPVVASDGSGFLVAWGDYRDSASNACDVRGARVSGTGSVLDAGSLAIQAAAYEQRSPAIAWNGTDYLVVWSDWRQNLMSCSDVYGARVTSAGALPDPQGFPVSLGANEQAEPAIAWNGSNWLVAFMDRRDATPDWDLFAVRVDAAGTVLDPAGIAVTTAAGDQSSPAVAARGADFLVVWADTRVDPSQDIYGARVTGTGTLLDPGGIAIGAATSWQAQFAVASDGVGWLVVWADNRGADLDVYGGRVSQNGQLLDGTGFAVSSVTGSQSAPSLAWNGSHYLAAWADYRNGSTTGSDIYGAILDATGGVVANDLPISIAPAEQSSPALAASGGAFLAVWADSRSAGSSGVNVYGARISDSGTVADSGGIAISTATGDQTLPAVAPDGAGYFVAWQDGRNAATSGADVYGTRVAASGAVVAPTGLPVSAQPSDEQGPALAAGPAGELLVAYHGYDATPGVLSPRARVRTLTFEIPSATPPTLSLAEDSSAGVTLAGTGADGRPLAYTVTALPAHGTLTGTAPALTYSPAANYFGADSLQYTVSDGFYTSTPGTVAVTVVGSNDAPVATPQSVSVAWQTARAVTLAATDVDGDPLGFAVEAQPIHGTLSGTPPNLTYAPAAGYEGADSFTFTATDGSLTSAPATVSLTVLSQILFTPATPSVAPRGTITLGASGGAGAPYSWSMASAPSGGSVVAGSGAYTAGGAGGVTDAVRVADAMGFEATVDVDVTAGVSVSPAFATVRSGASQDFVAAGGSGSGWTWTISDNQSGGVINSSGRYVAGPITGVTDVIRVQDGLLNEASASVSVTSDEAVKRSAYGCSSAGGSEGPVLLLLGVAALALLRTRRRGGAALLAVALALPLAAQAAPKEQKTRVAIMPIKAGLGVEPKLAELVTDALVADLADRGLLTITSKDVEAALGFERQKTMLGCGDQSCLAEIAGALGADRVVSGDIAQVRELTVFSVQLFNTKSGTVEKRFHERMSGGEAADLLDATERAGEELFPGTVRAGKASRKKSVLTSTARPLALFARGGYDVQDPGGFGLVGLEYRVSRSVRLGLGGLGTGAQTFGAAVRAGWYPLVFERLSIYGAAEAHVIFASDLLVAANVALGVEWAFSERLAMSVEVPVTLLASAPAEYQTTYFMPGFSASWRF